MVKYVLGQVITNPNDTKEKFLFAGYKGNQEYWCDVAEDEEGTTIGNYGPRTFEAFNGKWTQWSQDLEQFASEVDRELCVH